MASSHPYDYFHGALVLYIYIYSSVTHIVYVVKEVASLWWAQSINGHGIETNAYSCYSRPAG